MRVGRTVEQLRQRRHAFLGTYVPPAKERQLQKVDPAEQVGLLKGEVGGEKVALIITLGEDFWIGRRPECDLVINDPTISNFHMRIYAVRTSCDQSLICVHDLSTNGFTLNGAAYRSDQQINVGGVPVNPRSVILRPGDILSFPGCSIDLVCRYYSGHSISTQNDSGQVHCHLPALFKSSDSTLSRTLNPWTIRNFSLGTGSFGRVHLATHNEKNGLQAACKTVALNKQIEIEVQILNKLHHPNLCGIYDVFKEEEAQLIHLFLPLVTGGDLFSYLEKHGSLTEDETKFAALQLIKAVDFLHQAGIAHRDLKPENVLLHKSGAYPHLLLADFGLATTRDQVLSHVPYARSNVPERQHRSFTGTSLYLPPERLKAILSRKRSQTGQAESAHGIAKWRLTVGEMWFGEETMLDIWALGVILCVIMTGYHPYDDNRYDRDDTVVPRGTEASRASTTRPSSAQSWQNFRSTNPSGIVGDGPQTEQEKEWRRVEEKLIRFCKLRSSSWQPSEKWVYISSEGREFVAGFLQPHPSKRFTLEQASQQSWLTSQQSALDKIYETVVTEGKLERASVWNFNGGVQPSTNSVRAAPITARLGEYIDMEDDSMIRGSPLPLPRGNQEASSHDGLSELDSSGSPALPITTSKQPVRRKTSISESTTTAEPKKKGRSKKVVPATNISDPPTSSTSKSIKKKPGPKPNSKKATSVAQPSLFLNSPLFGLDDIAEEAENENEEAERVGSNLANAAATLNDVMNASTAGGDEDAQMGGEGGVEESHPPRKAGQRKSVAIKKAVKAGPSTFQSASVVASISGVSSSVGASSSSKPSAPRKSAFQAPAKRAGVVLKRVEKIVA